MPTTNARHLRRLRLYRANDHARVEEVPGEARRGQDAEDDGSGGGGESELEERGVCSFGLCGCGEGKRVGAL